MLVWLGLVLGLRLLALPVTLTNAVTGRGLVLGTGTYESGTPVTLRAAPQVDWKFDHWEGVPAALSPKSEELLTTHNCARRSRNQGSAHKSQRLKRLLFRNQMRNHLQ